MLVDLESIEVLNKALQKAEGKITRAQAKAKHKDLPPGGVWRTIRGHHIYIVNGKVVAGSLPGVRGAKKATKAHLREYQAHIDAEKAKKEGKKETAAKKKATATKKKTTKTTKAKDIRTEAQKTRKVSYDVGEKIGGARKDLAQKRFIEKPSLANLAELEKVNPKLAYKFVTKQNLLPKMDEDYVKGQYHQGVDLKSTILKQLLYGRIATRPEDSPEARQKYISAVRRIQDIFEPIKDFDKMKDAIYDVSFMMTWGKDAIDAAKRRVEADKKNLKKPIKAPASLSETQKAQWEATIKKQRKAALEQSKTLLKRAQQSAGYDFSVLGDKFYNLFKKTNSLNSTLRSLENTLRKKGDTWDKFLSAKDKEALGKKKKQNRREEWKREIPDTIKRTGGRKTPVKKPEDMMKTFGFRGVEFGHWVDDDSGKVHLIKASEAFHDLADVLGLQDSDVSLNGKLGMAFGARGKGRALAHYEPTKKVINLTKEGGSGSLAHEWGHALDNLLWEHSHGFSSGKTGYMSEGNAGSDADKGVIEAYKEVMDAIKKGDHTEHVKRDENRYTTTTELVDHYEKANGDLAKAVASYIKGIRNRYDQSWKSKESFFRMYNSSESSIAKARKKHEQQLARLLKMAPQAMAHYHEQQTGEKVMSIPVPTEKSRFLADAEARDGKRHYWSSDVELFARAFESYVQDALEKKKRRNDYLVCGTKPQTGAKGTTSAKQAETMLSTILGGYPYPQGEERKRINKAMEKLMRKIRQSKSITKALEALTLLEKMMKQVS